MYSNLITPNIIVYLYRLSNDIFRNLEVPYFVKIASFNSTQGASPCYIRGLLVYVCIGLWRYLTKCGQQPASFIKYSLYLIGRIIGLGEKDMGASMQGIKSLLSSVSSDSRGAFECFYNLYYDQVFRFAYYCLGEKEACKDVVSEVFFSIWKSKERLKGIDNINTYLYTTVRNEVLRYQARNTYLNRISIEDLSFLDRKEENTPDKQLETKEVEEILSQAVDELPEKCRLIFLMSREEGLKTKEIAEILSIQESTVRVQMKIAIEKLVTQLRPRFPNISFVFALMFILMEKNSLSL